MSMKETIARTKYCPLLSLFLKAPTNCLGRSCMFWTETEDNGRGSCDVKEYFRASLKSIETSERIWISIGQIFQNFAELVYELYRKKMEETK
jgi:hypothetical protein